MWASKIKTFVSLFKQKRFWVSGIFLLVIATGLIVHFATQHNKAAFTQQIFAANQGPTKAQLEGAAQKAVTSSLAAKNYASAVDYYLVQASQAPDNKSAEQILKEAVANIPDQDVPYTIYDSLANVAKSLGDKTTEISSLQKALTKAQLPQSGAPTDLITLYQKELKQLGASG